LVLLHLDPFDHASRAKPFKNPGYLVPSQFPDLVEIRSKGLNKLAELCLI
jgi:hypothetical protein